MTNHTVPSAPRLPSAPPRDAATVVVLRDAGAGMEVYLVKRSREVDFMANAHVFPGGRLDAADGSLEACAVRETYEEAGLRLDPAALVPWVRWITPEISPRRFDARFYLALAPAHTPPRADGNETVDARWFEPAAALEAADRGEISLAFPTITQLGLLAEHPTSDEALAAYREATVEPILPVVVGSRENARVLLPDDPDYPR